MSLMDNKFVKNRKHIFAKYHLYALALNISSLFIFSEMTNNVIDKEFITRMDAWLNVKMMLSWNPLLNKIMIFITNIASPTYMIIFSVILFGFFAYKKRWYYSLLLLFGMIGGLLIEQLIKLIVQRARPENALIQISEYSFPSGHATMAIIFFSLLLYCFKDNIQSKRRKYIFIIANVIIFLLIGFSRIYLSVHWFSDVVAGFSLGLFWFTLLILVFNVIISFSNKSPDSVKD
jgi:undecaprenyl-diphosphatase